MSVDAEHLKAWIDERATADGDCLIWKRSSSNHRQPQGRYLGKIVIVRREIIKSRNYKSLPKNWVGMTSCGNEACVNPDHVILKTRSSVQKGPKTQAHKNAVAVAMRKSRRAKITQEIVNEIRSSAEPRGVMAERFGITKHYINQIRAYRVWRDFSNPFAGLMA